MPRAGIYAFYFAKVRVCHLATCFGSSQFSVWAGECGGTNLPWACTSPGWARIPSPTRCGRSRRSPSGRAVHRVLENLQAARGGGHQGRGAQCAQLQKDCHGSMSCWRNKTLFKATGEHFKLPGHDKKNMKFTILEKVRSADTLYGREREKKITLENSTHYMLESIGSHDMWLYNHLTIVDIF